MFRLVLDGCVQVYAPAASLDTLSTPLEEITAGDYEPTIANYSYFHAKSIVFRERGDKGYMHAKTPFFLAGA